MNITFSVTTDVHVHNFLGQSSYISKDDKEKYGKLNFSKGQ